MDAREVKMSNLLRQRSYIQERLDKLAVNSMGDAGYDYPGDLFHENREFFRNNHWEVREVIQSSSGKIIYHFSCANASLSYEDKESLGLDSWNNWHHFPHHGKIQTISIVFYQWNPPQPIANMAVGEFYFYLCILFNIIAYKFLCKTI